MPSQIAHYVFAMDLADSTSFGKMLDPGYLFLGAQGPDIFYHNLRTKPSAVSYGGLIHRRDWGRMSQELLKRLPLSENWARSYFLGWISHGLLDRDWHPYIIYRSGWKDPGDPKTAERRFFHPYLERVLDVAFFRYQYSKSLREVPFQPSLPEASELEDRLLEPMVEALDLVYGKDPDLSLLEQRVINAFGDSVGFFRYFDPYFFIPGERSKASDRSLSLVHPWILDDQDYLNLSHTTWVHPGTLGSHKESIPELYLKAKVKGQAFLDAMGPIEKWLSHAQVVEENLGNASLNLVDEQGMRVGPKTSSPYDLGKLMDIQRREFLELR